MPVAAREVRVGIRQANSAPKPKPRLDAETGAKLTESKEFELSPSACYLATFLSV